MIQIQLIVRNGVLHFPNGGHDAMNGQWDCPELPSCLYHRHEEGDVTTFAWPLPEDARVLLASALYDERETNTCWPNVPVSILLPDGTPFDFDAVLYEDEPYIGHQREYNPDNFHGI